MKKRRMLLILSAVFLAAALLLILILKDIPERRLRACFEAVVYDSSELKYCRLIPHRSAVVVYTVKNETGFLADSLAARRQFEDHIRAHPREFSGAEIKLQFSFPDGHVSAYYYNYDHINYDHIAESHHCKNAYDLHYAEISDNDNDSLSVLQQDTDLEYLSLSGMKDYDLSYLRDFSALKEVAIAAPKSAEQIKETIDASQLPDGCALWIEAEQIK